MTVANNYAPVKYTGNGSTRTFSVGWRIESGDDFVVYQNVGGTESVVDPDNYTTSVSNNGSSVTFDTAPASGTVIAITRSTPQEQDTPYKTSSGFQAIKVEEDFDGLTMMVQELQQDVDRSVKVKETDTMTGDELRDALFEAKDEAAASAALAQDWATKTDGKVGGVDYSAKYYAQESAGSAGDAASAANTADSYKDLAKDWATKMDGKVNNEDYSAKYYAGQSASSASTAQTYTDNAQIWAEGADAQVQGLGGEHSAKGWAEQESSNYSVTATGTNISRTLKDRFADIVNVKDYGAKGDGTTNDTSAFSSFENVDNGMHYVPSGDYKIDGNVIGVRGKFTTVLSSSDYQKCSMRPDVKNVKPVVNIHKTSTKSTQIGPVIAVTQSITDNDDGVLTGYPAGIYSYVEQNGNATQAAPKAICGVTVNDVVGDNDSTAVGGYSYKLNRTGGVGDTCGTGGVSWQFSTEAGLVIGGEFSCHQNVSGTSAANFFGNGNYSESLHVSCNSIGSRTFAGIALDTFGLNDNHYGFWNAILVGRSCFAHSGQPEAGTVGINFAGCQTVYPEKEFYNGNAKWHHYRESGSIRNHCGAFDIENSGNSSVFCRLITPSDNPQTVSFLAAKGSLGADGNTNITEIGGLKFPSSGRAMLETPTTSVSLSATNSIFYPTTDNQTSLGNSTYKWKDVYAVNGTIQTSDERKKAEIEEIPEAVLRTWGQVNWMQYKLKSSIEEKGDKARLHIGLIAQRVKKIFEDNGLDALKYGILCYEQWDAEPDEVIREKIIVEPEVRDKDDNLIKEEKTEIKETIIKGREAGDSWSIRYDEALALECAYQRWKLEQLEKRLS